MLRQMIDEASRSRGQIGDLFANPNYFKGAASGSRRARVARTSDKNESGETRILSTITEGRGGGCEAESTSSWLDFTFVSIHTFFQLIHSPTTFTPTRAALPLSWANYSASSCSISSPTKAIPLSSSAMPSSPQSLVPMDQASQMPWTRSPSFSASNPRIFDRRI